MAYWRPGRLQAPRGPSNFLGVAGGMVAGSTGTVECAGGDGGDGGSGTDISTRWTTTPLPQTIRVPFCALVRTLCSRSIQTTGVRHSLRLSHLHCHRRRPYEGAFPEHFVYHPKRSTETMPWCPGYSGAPPSPPPSLAIIFLPCATCHVTVLSTCNAPASLHSNLLCFPSLALP